MKTLKLAQKVATLVVAILLLILVVVGFFAIRDINEVAISALDMNLAEEGQLVQDLIDSMQAEALQVATVLAYSREVIAAYREPDTETGRAALAEAMQPVVRQLSAAADLGDTYRVHFHKPPAVSFYRTWTDRADDDLSSFRATIMEVYRTREPLKTVELGRGGFVIRGLAPIIDDGEYLGSVEVYFQPTRIVPFLDSGMQTGVVLLVNADAAENLFFEEDLEEYFMGRVGDSMVSAVTADWIDPATMIDPAVAQQVTETGEIRITAVENYLEAYVPLEDFSGQINGHIVSIVDVSSFRGEARARMLRLVAIVVGLIVVSALILLFMLQRVISVPLTAAADNLKQIALGDGDLSLRMAEDRGDEIGRLGRHFNNFVGSLGTIVSSIQQATTSLTENAVTLDTTTNETRDVAGSIVKGVSRVAERIHEQDSSITQSSASVEQISGNITSLENVIGHLTGNIDDSAASVEEMAANISSITRNLEKVDEYVRKLVTASDRGRVTITQVTDRINEVVEQSEQLQKANQLIAAVSAQTNLLAMNAAIEAAHAGEYGRGFAVVAEEIRSLAENSAEQTKVISGELKKTRAYIDNAVEASREADDAFGSMREMVSTVTDLETNVRDALREQEHGSESVMGNLQQMREIGTQVSGGVSEISDGSRIILEEMTKLVQISRQVTELMEEISTGGSTIDSAMDKLSDRSSQNRRLVDVVRSEVGRFQV